jgi:hypothetical protein
MTTTGHRIFLYIKSMVTGWGEVEDNISVEEWEKAD